MVKSSDHKVMREEEGDVMVVPPLDTPQDLF